MSSNKLDSLFKKQKDYSTFKIAVTSLNNAGGVGKSTLLESIVELLDFNEVSRHFASLDPKHGGYTLEKFGQRDGHGNPLPNNEQDPAVGVKLYNGFDERERGAYVNQLSAKAEFIAVDTPSEFIDFLLKNVFNGSVQSFVDAHENNNVIPKFVIPYTEDKCMLSVQELEQAFSSVSTKLPIHFIIVLNKGLMKDERMILDMYNKDQAIKMLKKKFKVDTVVLEQKFSPVLQTEAKTRKLIDIAQDENSPVLDKETALHFIYEISEKLLPVIQSR